MSVNMDFEYTKDLAIEFSLYLLEREVTKSKGYGSEPITYHPMEYNLLSAEIISKGDKLFNDFILSKATFGDKSKFYIE